MRVVTIGLALGTALLASACNNNSEEKRDADQRAAAAGFVPPSVTSRVDFGGMMDRRFRTLDRDGNDIISADEMPSGTSRIRELDRNHDGEVTHSEYSEGTLNWFDRMDLNRDGAVTSEERESSRTERPATPTNPVLSNTN